ncbi:MAG: DUF4326 domain-containing protein [Gammaproteobacteria bacterium]|nr:DUF4326 domain-containing protein [Gammaproteobacteria bacterium]
MHEGGGVKKGNLSAKELSLLVYVNESSAKRIQRKRTKGYNMQAESIALNGLEAVSVCRPGKWGNPYEISHAGGARLARALFKLWLKKTETGRALAVQAKKRLRGKNLACWCKPGDPCHADVWLEIANE